MNYCFDLDGTISSKPEMFSVMMNDLMEEGNNVCVLTGAISGKEIREDERIFQLETMGIYKDEHYRLLKICVGADMTEVARGKAKFCRDSLIDCVFEDSEDYIRFIKAYSPNTVCLLVRQ